MLALVETGLKLHHGYGDMAYEQFKAQPGLRMRFRIGNGNGKPLAQA